MTEKKSYQSKQDKTKLIESKEAVDFFYQFNESVLQITGYSCPDENGELKLDVFSLVDKVVYSMMLHRYNGFVADNKGKKPLSTIYYDNQIDIAKKLGLDRKTVERSIKKLCDIGLVKKFYQNVSGVGARKSASYVVLGLFDTDVNWFYEYNNAEVSGASVTRVFLKKPVGKKVVAEKPVQKPFVEIDDPECPF